MDPPNNAGDDTTSRRPTAAAETNQDLTDRFKYKVNALMGVFDPMNTAEDTELATGSILTALVQFPAPYTFTVVGQTDGDETIQEEFVSAVHAIVRASSSSSSFSGGARSSDSSMDRGEAETTSTTSTCWKSQVIPRGKKYVKVTVEAQVDSASVITLIYQHLESLERCVMKF